MEIVRNDATDRVLIGLDYFDASINRVAAWIVGTRNMQKALLCALLMPHEALKQLQREQRFTELMAAQEALKTMPWGAVWEEFCARQQVPGDEDWMPEILAYEKDVLLKREEK